MANVNVAYYSDVRKSKVMKFEDKWVELGNMHREVTKTQKSPMLHVLSYSWPLAVFRVSRLTGEIKKEKQMCQGEWERRSSREYNVRTKAE